MRYETQFVDLQAQHTAVVCGHVTTAQLPEFLGSAFGEVITVLDKQGLIPTGAPFGRYRPAPAASEGSRGTRVVAAIRAPTALVV